MKICTKTSDHHLEVDEDSATLGITVKAGEILISTCKDSFVVLQVFVATPLATPCAFISSCMQKETLAFMSTPPPKVQGQCGNTFTGGDPHAATYSHVPALSQSIILEEKLETQV